MNTMPALRTNPPHARRCPIPPFDYCDQLNGTQDFVNILSASRSPRDCNEYAYRAKRIAERLPPEFTAVTAIKLRLENERQQFVARPLEGAGIVALPLDHFAT